MFKLEKIFSSQAKIKVLETLHRHRAPLALRHIEYLSELQIQSVQRAVKQLLDERRILFDEENHVYTIDRDHPEYALIAEIFDSVQSYRLHQRAKTYQASAKQALSFCNEANKLFWNLER